MMITLKSITRVRIRSKYLAAIGFVALIYLIIKGAHLKLFEKDFEFEFDYPINGDIRKLIDQMRFGQEIDIPPINQPDIKINKLSTRCSSTQKLKLVYVVKSYVENFAQRQIIRRTWGQEKRFNNVNIKTVFILGTHYKTRKDGENEVQKKVDEESREYMDIVQGDFIDSYYNNTLKMMMGLKWSVNSCPEAYYYAFIDDDYYVSTKNMLLFLKNPSNYPSYLKNISERTLACEFHDLESSNRQENPFGGKLYAGFVFHAPPIRDLFNKWFLTLSDYPYNWFPSYVTGGSYVLSKSALIDFYFGSFFVKLFPFDDVFLGIVAKKLAIEPFHASEFRFLKESYEEKDSFRYAITSHGFSDFYELEKMWNKQRDFGFA